MQSVASGFVAGLLAASNRKTGENQTVESSGLLRNIDAVTSVSGGTWFAASMLYSPSFLQMLERMGAAPDMAGAIYSDGYTKPLLDLPRFLKDYQAANTGIGFNTTEADCADEIAAIKNLLEHAPSRGDNATSDDNNTMGPEAKQIALELFSQVLALAGIGRLSWPAMTLHILWSTANLTHKTLLGGEVNSFAKGKSFLLATSLPMPGGNLSWGAFPDTRVYLKSHLIGHRSVSFQAFSDNSSEFAPWIPGKQSIVLGSGAGADSPLPYCAEKDCFGLHYKYTLKKGFRGVNAKISPPLSKVFDLAFQSKAGSLPLYQAVATSSAAAGSIPMSPLLGFAYGRCLDLTVWSTSKPEGESFRHAQESVMPYIEEALKNRKTFEKVATFATGPIVDGALTDLTGVAQALAAGATEVVAFLTYQTIADLFLPADRMDGPPNMLWISFAKFRLFEEDTSQVMAQYEGRDSATGKAFANLTIPEGSGTHLQTLSYGTIHATTVDCKWFGIKGGAKVNIHVLYADITLGMGATNSWFAYDTAIQEMISTMVHEPNRAKVEEMVSLVTG